MNHRGVTVTHIEAMMEYFGISRDAKSESEPHSEVTTSTIASTSAAAPVTTLLSVREIGFSQNSVAPSFTTTLNGIGLSLKSTVEKIVSGELKVSDIPPIRVVQYKSRWISLDNRRLRVFKDALVDKVQVVVYSLDEPEIKKEFNEKKTNKSISEGGSIRNNSSRSDDDHFEQGAYIFNKIILGLSIDEIATPSVEVKYQEKLPNKFESVRAYYSSFQKLILEEARAILQVGMEAVEQNKADSCIVAVEKFKASKNVENPSSLTLSKITQLKESLKSCDALLIVSEENPDIKLIGLVNYLDPEQQKYRILVKVIVDEDILIDYPNAFNEGKKWGISTLGSLITQQRMYQTCLLQPTPKYVNQYVSGDLQLSSGASTSFATDFITEINFTPEEEASLNESQKRAIEKFINLKRGMQLIEGPPGTGKTSTIIALIKKLIEENSRIRILITAPSNQAVQVLAEKLLSITTAVPSVLVGVEEKLPENSELYNIFLHTLGDQIRQKLVLIEEKIWLLMPTLEKPITQAEMDEHLLAIYQLFAEFVKLCKLYKLDIIELQSTNVRTFVNAIKNYRKQFNTVVTEIYCQEQRKELSQISMIVNLILLTFDNLIRDDSITGLEGQLMNNSQLIFATLSTTGRKLFKELTPVDVLIVDEAGQALEAETLIPFANNPKKCVLIGDTKQLPATVISQLAMNKGFARSMLQRLLEDCKQPYDLLNIQYRMHSDISAWISREFYKGLVLNAPIINAGKRSFPALENAPAILAPYSFIDIAEGQETSVEKSYVNLLEADYIVRILDHLSSQYTIDVNEQVSVITFYNGQVKAIKDRLNRYEKLASVRVQSVDSFQGGECQIILISCVRSDRVGFLADFRRLNVALTRAQFSLMILGNANALLNSTPVLTSLVKDASTRKRLFTLQHLHEQIPNLPAIKPAIVANTPEKQAKVCRFFDGHPKSCYKGKACDFVHAKTDHKATAHKNAKDNKAPATTQAKISDKQSNRCRLFNGHPKSCHFGSSCKFAHIVDESTSQTKHKK